MRKPKLLTLGDLKGKTDAQIRRHLVDSWKVHPSELCDMDLLVAYESVGDYGCDSSGFYVFRRRNRLYEVHGSHCSCMGFEDQWRPERTSLEYFRSTSFSFCTGGYDGEGSANVDAVRKFFAK